MSLNLWDCISSPVLFDLDMHGIFMVAKGSINKQCKDSSGFVIDKLLLFDY